MKSSPLKRGKPLERRSAISPASPKQRAKATFCIVTGVKRDDGWTVDPAHLASRAHGGCDSPLCVVGLRREIHRAFDDGKFDLLPYLRARGCVAEICHALEHYDGNMPGLLHRLTGERYVPEP